MMSIREYFTVQVPVLGAYKLQRCMEQLVVRSTRWNARLQPPSGASDAVPVQGKQGKAWLEQPLPPRLDRVGMRCKCRSKHAKEPV